MQNLMNSVLKIVKTDKRVFADGKLLKNKLTELALKLDAQLIGKLLTDSASAKAFFIEGSSGKGKVLVFDRDKFIGFINNKEFLPDSFTSFKNRIGLMSNDSYIKENSDVVLAWPYKDCVLEGGQDKVDQKRDEIFFNQILGQDEIDRLFDEKVLDNFKRVTSKGEHPLSAFKDTDNLIVRGNNLIALHSLKHRYSGRIKLIYIDPPYYFHSTKNEDTFEYNSNFKLSTWLTFMRNRLEIARELLSDDGAIFVQISDDGVGELHVLLKEIFNKNGENNFINKITIKTKSPSGFASVNPGVFETAEYVLAFAKNKKKWEFTPQFVESSFDENYKWVVSNKTAHHSKWVINDLYDHVAKLNKYKDKKAFVEGLHKGAVLQLVAEYALENADSVFRMTAIGDNAGEKTVKLRELSKKKRGEIFKLERDDNYDIFVMDGQEIAFYSKKIRVVDGERVPTIQLSNIWTDVPYEGIAREGDVTLKGGKKPEKLIRRIIDIATKPGDIVMDYHVGSGTTAAVAHKMGRQYIGVEQLFYGENDVVVRLKNVLSGDQTGISKAIGWKGGGEFVYLELKELNETYMAAIQNADSTRNLLKIWEQLRTEAFLRYEIDLSSFDEKEFSKLAMNDQKVVLMECLEKNHLYLNYSEIGDGKYKISADVKKLNKEFYGR